MRSSPLGLALWMGIMCLVFGPPSAAQTGAIGPSGPDDPQSFMELWPDETLDPAVSQPLRASLAQRGRVQTLKQAQLRRVGALSSSEALELTLDSYIPKGYAAGGAPLLDGFGGRHVLLLLDGIRLDHTLTASGQTSPIDLLSPYDLDQLELRPGTQSALYGSGAIGGVIQLQSAAPSFDPRRLWDLSTAARLGLASAAWSPMAQLETQGHWRALGLRLGGTLRRFGNVRAGDSLGTQADSAWYDGTLAAHMVWQAREDQRWTLSYYGIRRSDLTRPDLATDLNPRVLAQEDRDLVALRYQFAPLWPWLQRGDVAFSYQAIRQQQHLSLSDTTAAAQTAQRVHSIGAQLTLQTHLPYNDLSLGADAYLDLAQLQQSTQPSLDGAYELKGHLFLHDRLALTKRLALDLGTSFGASTIDSGTFATQASATSAQRQHASAIQAHAFYQLSDGLTLTGGIGRGYAFYNLADLIAQPCISSATPQLRTDLKSNQSWSAETSVRLSLYGRAWLSLGYAYAWLDHAAWPLCPSTTTGSGTSLAMHLPAPLSAITTRQHALQAGITLALDANWSLAWRWEWVHRTIQQLSSTYAGAPLAAAMTPPLHGELRLGYTQRAGRWFAEAVWRWAKAQPTSSTPSTTAPICTRAPALCSPSQGYITVALRGGVRLSQALRLVLRLDNLSDEAYRLAGSYSYAMGFNALALLEYARSSAD